MAGSPSGRSRTDTPDAICCATGVPATVMMRGHVPPCLGAVLREILPAQESANVCALF